MNHRCFQELVLMLACGPSWALHLGSSRYGISWAGAVWKHRRSSMNLSLRHLHLAGNDSGWTVWQPEKSTLALGYTGMQNCGIWHWHIILACHLYCMITDDHIVWITCSKDFKSNWDILRLLPFCSQINAVQQQSSVYLVVQHVRLRVGNKSTSIRVAFVNVVIADSPYDEVFFLTQAEKSGDETTLLRCWRFRVEKSEKSQVVCSTLLSVSKSELMASDQRHFLDRSSSSINIREEWRRMAVPSPACGCCWFPNLILASSLFDPILQRRCGFEGS